MNSRLGFRVDLPEGDFADLAHEAEHLGIDLGDLLAIAAAILVAELVDARREVGRAVTTRRKAPGRRIPLEGARPA
jgi:hypothetical protein